MADLRSIGSRMDAAGAARLTAALARAFAAGDDLGPRAAQIRALGLSLESLTGVLRAELVALDAALAELGVRSSGHPGSYALLVEVERVADLARAYGDPAVAGTAGPTDDATPRSPHARPRSRS